jgi:hypothetical protein
MLAIWQTGSFDYRFQEILFKYEQGTYPIKTFG